MTTRLTAGPPDAKINPEGFRTYRWPVDGVERELLSVTSIRKLVGEPYGLVNWQINKIVDRALTDEYWEKRRGVMLTMDGPGVWLKEPLDELTLRKWLRSAATEERDAAANKGLDIHGALEMGWEPEQCNEETRPYIRQVRHFLDTEGWEIEALEKTVFNLTVGYAGTLDVILRHRGTGRIAIGDWKTGKSVYTEHPVQLHAYMAGEFIGTKGVVNERLTDMLRGIDEAGILHVSPTGWEWLTVPFDPVVLRAFFGAVAFAQLLAAHKRPDKLFSETRKGSAPE